MQAPNRTREAIVVPQQMSLIMGRFYLVVNGPGATSPPLPEDAFDEIDRIQAREFNNVVKTGSPGDVYGSVRRLTAAAQRTLVSTTSLFISRIQAAKAGIFSRICV